jgi:hypothetical protein
MRIFLALMLLAFPAHAEEIQPGDSIELKVRARVVDVLDIADCVEHPDLPGCEFVMVEE